MKLPPDCLTSLASRGYLSIQVPECDVDIVQGRGVANHVSQRPEAVEYPDDWFIRVSKGVVAVGRRTGYLHLSRRGWEANRDALRIAFTAACENGLDRTGGEGFPAFVRYVEEFFSDVERKTNCRIQKLTGELEELRTAVSGI